MLTQRKPSGAKAGQASPTQVPQPAPGALQSAGARATPGVVPLRQRQAPSLRIQSSHPGLLGSNQTVSFQAHFRQDELDLRRRTVIHWELLRMDGDTPEKVGDHYGATYTVAPGQRGHYMVRCAAESMDTPGPLQAQAVSTATVRPPLPRPALAGLQERPHQFNPYTDKAGQHQDDQRQVGADHQVVDARDDLQFQVVGAEAYSKTMLEHHKSDYPLGTLEEEVELIPAMNEANRTMNSDAREAVNHASDALRSEVNLKTNLPGRAIGEGMSSTLTQPRRVSAVLTQDDGQDVHLRLFATEIQARGQPSFVRLTALPVVNPAKDAKSPTPQVIVRSFNGSPMGKPEDYATSFRDALSQYLEYGPGEHGLLSYEVEGKHLSGTVRKEDSDLKTAADAMETVQQVSTLLAMIPPVALPFRVLSVAMGVGAAGARTLDKYHKAEDNTAEAADVLTGLIELGGEAFPKVAQKRAVEMVKGVADLGSRAVKPKEKKEGKEKMEEISAEVSVGMAILKDALSIGRVVTPDAFPLVGMRAGRVLVELGRVHSFGGKVLKYVSLPDTFFTKFGELQKTRGLTDAERRTKMVSLVAELAK